MTEDKNPSTPQQDKARAAREARSAGTPQAAPKQPAPKQPAKPAAGRTAPASRPQPEPAPQVPPLPESDPAATTASAPEVPEPEAAATVSAPEVPDSVDPASLAAVPVAVSASAAVPAPAEGEYPVTAGLVTVPAVPAAQQGSALPEAPAWEPGIGAVTRELPAEAQEPHRSARRDREEGPEPASSLTADRLLSISSAPPVSGWRLWLYKATFGYVNLGDSDKVRIRRALEHRIAARLGQRTRYVPVLSRKGGVGKTTVTSLLGLTLAELREDRVIAVDANPDRGTLSDRSPGRADATARQLVRDRFRVQSFSELANYVSRDGSRLDILASDTDPAVAHAFDDSDYRAVTEILDRYYSIVLTDSGTGMVHSVMKGTLEKADGVVLVSGGSVDEARLASETLSWLEAHGRHDLVAKAVVVINMSAGEGTLVNVDEIEEHFKSRVRTVVRIPYDRHLAEGSRIELAKLRPATRAAAVELAALVVDELQGN